MTDIKGFLNADGKIKIWPSKAVKKQAVLRYLSSKFEVGRDYSEREVNSIITEWHTFGDLFILRRGMIESGLMNRMSDGSRYWREVGESSESEY